MGAEDNQPDWQNLAGKFDLWLPQLAPVGEALLAALDAHAGQLILDVASGTGEPALTLARRMAGQAEIIGVDAAEGMVKVSNDKVLAEGLTDIEFRTMPGERLDFPDGTFDRVLCRFGVMLFEDPAQGLKEMYRVLKPGGHIAIAVWSTPETMPTMQWAYHVFENRVPSDFYPPLLKATSLGAVGVLDGLIEDAGFAEYEIQERPFNYEFASFDDYWDLVEASDIMKMQFDALPDDLRNEVRDEVARFARDCVVDGRLVIPHEYLLAVAKK